MIVLLKGGSYFIDGCDSVRELLIAYVEYTRCVDSKIFKILANSDEMSLDDLVKHINDYTYSYDEQIEEIYEIGKKVY